MIPRNLSRRAFDSALALGSLTLMTASAPTTFAQSSSRNSKLPPIHLDEFRAFDGSGNNLTHPEWGIADSPFLRLTTNDYGDGFSSPSGDDRPNPRAISNAVCAQDASEPNTAGVSDYLWQWGQFLDHDITETPTISPAEAFDVAVPSGDPWFDPDATGSVTIPLNRSYYETADGIRSQINAITCFIDGSQVYGSDDERAAALRTNDGTGRLKTSAGNLLPFNTDALENAPSAYLPTFFVAGDVRANEQLGLTAMHTLFVREHNYWAGRIAAGEVSPLPLTRTRSRSRQPGGSSAQQPRLSGEEIYQTARAIVAAEIQAITYREFLPVLLGRDALPEWQGYDPNVEPGIANVFATAAYRLGHTMLSPELLRLDSQLEPIEAGNVSLADSFFNPDEIVNAGGIDPILRGLASQRAQQLDSHLVDEVRNFLFGDPGEGGFDLATLNIQRGRDHGLPGFNRVREDFGLTPYASIAEFRTDEDTRARIASVYTSVDTIDPWVGMLAEQPVAGSLVGETLFVILTEQFVALREGDRFWYRNYLSRDLADMIERQTLATIIRRNTGIGDEIPDDVFRVRESTASTAPPPPRGKQPPARHGGPRR